MILHPERSRDQAGKKISEIENNFSQKMPPQQEAALMKGELEKQFGTLEQPNMDLMPNVPAQERPRIMQILQKEIMAQNREAPDPADGPTLKNVQSWKKGWGKKAEYDKSITSGEVDLARNINGAYNKVATTAAPELEKWNKQYGAAMDAMSKHGGGVTGAIHQALTGGGALGWGIRAQFVYPAVRGILHALSSNNAQPVNADQPQHIGFGQQ